MGFFSRKGGKSDSTASQPASRNGISTQSQASGNPNIPASNGASGPGAFSVDSSSSQGTVFRVSVPQGVTPGQEFQVHAGDRIVRVRCPPDTRPGQFLQITVPRDSDETQNGPPGHHRPSDQTNDSSNGDAFEVVIPRGVSGGQQFHVMYNGNQLTVTCPANASAGMKVSALSNHSVVCRTVQFRAESKLQKVVALKYMSIVNYWLNVVNHSYYCLQVSIIVTFDHLSSFRKKL